jgi:uncharacterized protein (UPF0332 family)
VAVPKPEHLFEQAEQLTARSHGRPRQVDTRRAISAAYYGIFHAVITAAVDEFIGGSNRTKSRYGLVYRSVSHAWLRELCKEVQKPTLPQKFKPYEPADGFGPNIVAFATALAELQEKRHAADYDPMIRVNGSDAIMAVATARAALKRFKRASSARRIAFLSLVLFPPRGPPREVL